MSFTERNLTPRAPAGPSIPDGVRAAFLRWLDHRYVSATTLWNKLTQHEGYGSWVEIDKDFRERFGAQAATEFGRAMTQHAQQGRRSLQPQVDQEAEPALRAIPAPLFLDVVEIAYRLIQYETSGGDLFVDEVNRLFAKHGVYYRLDALGRAQWHGDPGAYEMVLRPALDVLGDHRLQGARSEFETATGALRAGTAKELEDAVRSPASR